ncbi:MAG: hypothetical protein GXP35_12405, partial [Actinobacteria bacterium]|nr:hypothetical protein [Actinomycetota bacterium]
SAFDGRTLCADDPAPNFVHLSPADGGFFDRLSPANWVHGSMHPRADGHELIAERLEPYLRDLLAAGAMAENPRSDSEIATDLDDAKAKTEAETRGISDEKWIQDQIYATIVRALLPLGLLLLAGWVLALGLIETKFGLAQLLDPRTDRRHSDD